ncbi:MAG: hypothetical protein J07HB67_02541 [halophilic archaeon J07HB67]|jgi:hypothetical protein|nr:MAG: hypothetical protein J07HB67_02541 [halophilic archaeon J07HB67]
MSDDTTESGDTGSTAPTGGHGVSSGLSSDGGQTTGSLGTVTPTEVDGSGSAVRDHAYLFLVLLRKELTILVRYPVNFFGAVVSMFVIFLLMVVGGQEVGGASFSESLGGLVVGYLVFMLSQSAYQGLASSVGQEAQWGTLERLHLSPIGFGRVMIVSAVTQVLVSFIYAAILLPVTLLIANESLSIDLLTIVPITLLGLASVVGLGFVFGGASVLYKRVSSVFRLFQFGLIALIAAPVERFPWSRVFPIVQANHMLGRAMREGVGLREFPPEAFAVLVAVGVGYFAAGYGVFLLFVRRARKLGVLGDY